MAVSNGHRTAREMKMRLREKPLSELTEEFEQLSSISDCDVDLLCAYLDVLEEKAPVLPEGYDPAASYERFKEAHAELFDLPAPPEPEKAPSGKGRLIRLKQALVSFAALFCVVVLVADASGAGVLNRLIEWGAETFSLRPASGVMELESAGDNGFRSLQEALEYYEVENPAIPTWIPEQYTISKVSIFESNDIITISGRYVSNSSELFIRVAISFKDAFTFEEDESDNYVIYEIEGIPFILSTNLTQKRAVWNLDGRTYSINGAISEGDLKEMLGSIKIKE